MEFNEVKDFLDFKVMQYNQPNFIVNDPICIPHQYKQKQDIEIAALLINAMSYS